VDWGPGGRVRIDSLGTYPEIGKVRVASVKTLHDKGEVAVIASNTGSCTVLFLASLNCHWGPWVSSISIALASIPDMYTPTLLRLRSPSLVHFNLMRSFAE